MYVVIEQNELHDYFPELKEMPLLLNPITAKDLSMFRK